MKRWKKAAAAVPGSVPCSCCCANLSLSVLFVIVSLIILSSLGLDIGPLIAGAGVIGLAIGFGSQTLVRDILSGVFFLIDDAFRVGDYIETGGIKGMVQHISLRSVKLRHPRGMVFTIPFGDMGAVQNFSRDYIITKLDIRVRYDADIDKIRKIIKKIGKEFEQHEEIGPVLLSPIKSQGVREMDDSAMILRVKFKTPPGEQFVVRREVYKRIQERFREEGIEFAHRNVTVYLPPEVSGAASDESNGDGISPGAHGIKPCLKPAQLPLSWVLVSFGSHCQFTVRFWVPVLWKSVVCFLFFR